MQHLLDRYKAFEQSCGTSEIRDVVVLLEQSQGSGVEGQGNTTAPRLWSVSTAARREWGGVSGNAMGAVHTRNRYVQRVGIIWNGGIVDAQIIL